MQIWSMFQDSRGYLWIGTKGGISRYDGEKFTNYNQNDGIPDNQIDGICEDFSGNIWIATRFGISSFNGTTFTTYPFRNNNLQRKLDNILEEMLHEVRIFQTFKTCSLGEMIKYLRSVCPERDFIQPISTCINFISE